MSRCMLDLALRRLLLAGIAVAFLFASSVPAVARPMGIADLRGRTYQEILTDATRTEGDVWGGEQGTEPVSDGELTPVESPVLNLNSGHAGWLVRLASLLQWMRASLRLTSPE